MSHARPLLQLGKDLDRGSSNAQTEDSTFAPARPPAGDECRDFYIERHGVRYAGIHLIVDLYGADRIDELDHVKATLEACVEAAGATLLHIHLHHFNPNNGISGVAVLAESHISIHSWPERRYAALDVFMCGDAQPHKTIPVLRRAFAPDRTVVAEHLRGRRL